MYKIRISFVAIAWLLLIVFIQLNVVVIIFSISLLLLFELFFLEL